MSVSRPERSLLARDIPLLCPPIYDRRSAVKGGRLPSLRELRPHRPLLKPRWSPSQRERQRAVGTARFKQPAQCKLRSAPGQGQARINFSYDNHMSTSGEFCDKNSRQQFCEGPHEMHWKQWLWLNPNCTNFLFQPVVATFIDEHGFTRKATWDIGIELVSGPLVFAEIKADLTFFQMPEVALMVSSSVTALANHDAVFARLMGTNFDPLTLATLQSVFSNRRTSYNADNEGTAVLDAIGKAGGSVTLARAKQVLGGHPPEAEAKLCAMAMDRLIALDIGLPLSPDTQLSVAPVNQNEGQLRDFLAQFEAAE